MRKKSVSRPASATGVRANHLFASRPNRRKRVLILPKILAEEADKVSLRESRYERAWEIVKHWADLEARGHLGKKETSLDASFLHEVFGDALGYRTATASPEQYEQQRNFTVPGVGTADGALGNFSPTNVAHPLVVIELKAADADLDKDKFNGRTPVQQCGDYLLALPDCPWGIVSNFVSIRLYHRDKTQQAFEEFHLQDLRNERRFREFYCLFEVEGLVRSSLGRPPRAVQLLERSETRQSEVGEKLYETYRDNRLRLIEHLHREHRQPLDTSIRVAQKLIDRIIFVAFCEDRGLLPDRCIETVHRSIPPVAKVTNPRWRNFLDLFHGIDKGNDYLGLKRGYNGGLFEHDPDIDDLQLDDKWTNFFVAVAEYDFRNEVNVDVLGHLFERSITELEKLRVGGLLAATRVQSSGAEAAMPKSARRKRFGIYYTPIDFTQFIVQKTVCELIDARLEELRSNSELTREQLESDESSPAAGRYWREALEMLRQLKVCDPACGSGAFLIQAYDELEERYQKIVDQIIRREGPQADPLEDAIPDMILNDNLFGVDVSREAVEITQLALWIRSARLGKTLSDLSRNIVCGNSLVTDPRVHPLAIDWQAAFPAVFDRSESGFDCVIGNPPWERMKLQEREFFSLSAPDIANAVSAAQRRKLIAELETKDPELHARYVQAREAAERTLNHVRESGGFPLTGKGDINTYAVFAELARKLVAPRGRVGLLVPSGIATDNTTKEFFGQLIESQSLVCLYDFENKAPVFPDVHRSFKFCTLVFGGSQEQHESADFAFFLHAMEDLQEKNRHIALTAADLKRLNPNTRTCPIFRSRRDAELTRAIYRRVPILIDHARKRGGNPWGIKFVTMFHQTNDAELFHAPEELKKQGFKLDGNRWNKGQRTFLPLYEAKMIQAYDHRAASVVIEAGNWVRQGQTEPTALVSHQNPEFVVQPRWWVEEQSVTGTLKRQQSRGFIGFKDITSPTNQRTMIAAAIPWCAVTNHFPLLLTDTSPRLEMCLLANLNSFALDYVARQKIGGVTLNFFIVEQFPIFPPDRYEEKCPWDKRQTLERWISDRVLKLTCTADDLRPLAEAADFDPPVHKWNPSERARLLAELDAAYFILYGLDRDEATYVLSTFQGTDEIDESSGFKPGASILEAHDRLTDRVGTSGAAGP